MQHISQLCNLLLAVRDKAGHDFSGIGVIVSSHPDLLPVVPMHQFESERSKESTLATLANVSRYSSDRHDGFHLLSHQFEIISLSLYFSPPIVPGLSALRPKVGGRYLAALFGSALPSVAVTGVASRAYGIAVFQHGVEVAFKK